MGFAEKVNRSMGLGPLSALAALLNLEQLDLKT
jgi:hypothetical protein